MRLADLQRIDKCPRLSDIPVEKILSDLSLYGRIVITTNDIKYVSGNGDIPPHIEVSKDVETLHKLFNDTDTFVMPCPLCMEDRPYNRSVAYVPVNEKDVKKSSSQSIRFTSRVEGTTDDMIRHNVFVPDSPHYRFATNWLADIDYTQFTEHGSGEEYEFNSWDDYEYDCGEACKNGILQRINNFRIDFKCTLDDSHNGFADFIIIPAVSKLPDELEDYEHRLLEAQASNPTAKITMSEKEEEVAELYDKYRNAVLIVKVGQIPSLKDLQLFDTKKYRNILKKSYTDYTLAIALYAEGVGAGAFLYIRRILENLVENVHKECVAECSAAVNQGNEIAFDEAAYMSKRFNEKIDYLEKTHNKVIIPSELEQVRTLIYGVISKGVHELPDEECIKMFGPVKYVIDSILDEQIKQNEKKKRLLEIQKVLQSVPTN